VPSKTVPKSLVEAVQSVFEALEPFDDVARTRILQSATSLLGAPIASSSAASLVGAPVVQPVTRPHGDRPLSPVELIQEKRPATNPQRIALFAYYRERTEGLSRFAKDDLKVYFGKAKEPPPQNFDRDFRQAVKLGWIYEDGSDSYLTSKGLEAVETGFDGKIASRGAVAKKSGTKKAGNRKRATRIVATRKAKAKPR
jgi:hypothetical protein